MMKDAENIKEIPMMPEREYWQMIKKTLPYSYHEDHQLAKLIGALRNCETDRIIAFHLRTNELVDRACTDAMLCSCFLLNKGHATDDGFLYFRGWLISKGEAVYKAAMENPDSLANVCRSKREIPHFELFLYAGKFAYKAETKRDMSEVLPMFSRARIKASWDPDDSDSMRKLCPKLLDRFEELDHEKITPKTKGKRMQ